MTPNPSTCPICHWALIEDPIAHVMICPNCQLDFESAVTIKAKQEREQHEAKET